MGGGGNSRIYPEGKRSPQLAASMALTSKVHASEGILVKFDLYVFIPLYGMRVAFCFIEKANICNFYRNISYLNKWLKQILMAT